MITNAMSVEDVLKLPASVSMDDASRALGFSASKGRGMARADEFPCRVIKVGRSFKVPRSEIFRLLGIDARSAA